LGYSLPLLALEFVPLGLWGLGFAALTRKHLGDPNAFSVYIDKYYRLLILLTIPTGLLGFALADRIVVGVFGDHMREAGDLARIFSLIHPINFAAIPLTTAMFVAEHNVVPVVLGILRAAISLSAAFVFVKHFGTAGAVLSVALTTFIGVPLSLSVFGRRLGYASFPWRFLASVMLISSVGVLPALVLRSAIGSSLPVSLLAATGSALLLFALLKRVAWHSVFHTSEQTSIKPSAQ
jgi:O-antigen/teichoic acid export membrane protein